VKSLVCCTTQILNWTAALHPLLFCLKCSFFYRCPVVDSKFILIGTQDLWLHFYLQAEL
jgi:hypothetical protein